jgi:molybdenum-dependent DNA-binding transcriptional regulator ModE
VSSLTHERFEAEAASWIGDDPDRQAASLIRRLSKSHRRVEDRISKAVDKAVAEARIEWERGQTRGDEPDVSDTYDRVLSEYDALEQQAAELLEGDDAEADPRLALTRNLRRALKRHRAEVERVRDEVRQELITERKTEAAFRNLGIPEGPARALFQGIDPTDAEAMRSKADELRAAGLSWNGAPEPPAPKPVDPNLAVQQAMQQAAAGGGTPGAEGDLKRRMQAMEANPGAYSQEAIDAVVKEYNQAVDAAGRHGTSGALG